MAYHIRFHFLFFLFLFLGICFLLSGCQNTQAVTTKTIYANYYIRHTQQERTVRAEAFFLEGDSVQNRVPKQFASVLFEDKEMSFNQVNPQKPFYLFDGKSSGADQIQFRFIDDKGHQEEDIVSIPGMQSFTISTPLHPDQGADLKWEGTPLGKQESIVLLFTDENNRTTSMIMNGPSSSAQINVPAIKLKALQSGTNRLYLVRKSRTSSKMSEKNSNDRQVKAVTEFYTKTIRVEVVK